MTRIAHGRLERRGVMRASLAIMLLLTGLLLCGAGHGVTVAREAPWSVAQIADPAFPFARNDRVAQAIAGVQQSAVYGYTAGLTGETPITVNGQSVTLRTRNTYAEALLRQATQYVHDYMAARGLTVSYQEWSDAEYGVAGRNVIGELRGTVHPNEIVLVAAHLDDMPEGYRAPGADDDASGSAAVMMAAAALAGAPFERTLRFVFFTGEEDGLLGSAAYAQRARANNENIVAAFCLDMIGYDATNSGEVYLETRRVSDSGYARDLAIANVFKQVLSAYGIPLGANIDPIRDPDVDSWSFWEAGFPSVLAIEDTSDWNPNWHTVGDNLASLNMTYYTRYVQAVVGTAAHLAVPVTAGMDERICLPLVVKGY